MNDNNVTKSTFDLVMYISSMFWTMFIMNTHHKINMKLLIAADIYDFLFSVITLTKGINTNLNKCPPNKSNSTAAMPNVTSFI